MTGTEESAIDRLLEECRRGLTRVEYAERELDDVNVSIDQVLDGSAPAPRLVFRMEPAATDASNGHAHSAIGTS